MTTSALRKKSTLESAAIAGAICLAIALGLLCSNQGVGVLPSSIRWVPSEARTGFDKVDPVYSLFVETIAKVSYSGLPAAARWPQIVLFALSVGVAIATIRLRSNQPFSTAVPVALLIIVSPEVLRTFTVLSPQPLIILFGTFCLFAGEQFGRTRRLPWFFAALIAGLLAGFSSISGFAVLLAIWHSIQSARRNLAAWGHLLAAIGFTVTLALDHSAGSASQWISAPALVAFIIFLGSAIRTRSGIWLLWLLVIARTAFAIPWIIHAEKYGHDFAEVQWKHSPTIQAVNRLHTHPVIYTNRLEPMLLYCHGTVFPLPDRHDSIYLLLPHDLLTQDSFIVLFGDAHQQIAEINKDVPLEEFRILADGQILRADASAWAGGRRTPPFSDNTPSVPARRAAGHFEWWNQKHDGYVKQAAQGNIDLLFLGDSITDDFRKVPGAWDLFEERFGKYHAANFGIDGDHTQHLLFRILNGECDHIHPRVAVILIGTNNTADDSAAAIARGIGACVAAARQKMPQTRILLLGLFPRGGSASNNDKRPVIQAVNRQIAGLDNGDTVRFLDLYDKFLAADGSLSKQIMHDGLHPSLAGYHIWLDAMQPLLEQMMRLPPATSP